MLDGFSFSLRSYGAGEPIAAPRCHRLWMLICRCGRRRNRERHRAPALATGPAAAASTLSTADLRRRESRDLPADGHGRCGRIQSTTLAAPLQRPGLKVEPFEMTFEDYARKARTIPMAVLNGLDNIPGRHQVQRTLWPDVIVDGAIGDFTCQVSRHPWPDDIACLICLFQGARGRLGRDSSE